jgi:hypothetical protein
MHNNKQNATLSTPTDSSNNDPSSSNVMRPDLQTQLEAAAFRSLVAHLQERSDSVSNMDMMTTTGFCRNCLAKVRSVRARASLIVGG